MIHFLKVWPRLPVSDLRRTVRFYTELLGFEAGDLWPDEESADFVILGRDEIRIQFYRAGSEADPAASPATGQGALNFEVSDVRGMHQALLGKLPIEWGPEVYTYGRREFAVRDPDGYLVIFTEETDDPPTLNEP